MRFRSQRGPLQALIHHYRIWKRRVMAWIAPERRHFRPRGDLYRKYRPDQPRVPAGSRDGGQWTSDGESDALSESRASPNDRVRISPRNELIQDTIGEESWKWHLDEFRPDGSLERQTVSNRDGSTIQLLFSQQAAAVGWDERHSVLLGDTSIVTFENAGPVQTVYGAGRYRLAQTVWTPDGSEPQPIAQQVFLPPLPFVVGGATAMLESGLAAQRGLTAGLTLFHMALDPHQRRKHSYI